MSFLTPFAAFLALLVVVPLAAFVIGAERLRLELGDVPTGLASITDRTLPHVFPTPDVDTFETALVKAMGIERPPPSDGFSIKVTTLGSLAHVATDNFYSVAAKHRLCV